MIHLQPVPFVIAILLVFIAPTLPVPAVFFRLTVGTLDVDARAFLLAAVIPLAVGATLTHDNISHTSLGLFDVEAHSYDPTMDLFAATPRSGSSSAGP
jgi:hypothetical protein